MPVIPQKSPEFFLRICRNTLFLLAGFVEPVASEERLHHRLPTKLRNRLNPKNVNKLIFIKSNLPAFYEHALHDEAEYDPSGSEEYCSRGASGTVCHLLYNLGFYCLKLRF
ncbi:hypothetical protein DYB32_008999 [Aphanomyces invadans]|uniref:HAT C-terminal dimerisation domain-containing protein n=1 Tax=Aphanomyces invadans TaxID=157072 RepID=A0A418AJM1_9STRA|nr:hypothetical protein DYB32_008999 [Aphanomyces invadans]